MGRVVIHSRPFVTHSHQFHKANPSLNALQCYADERWYLFKQCNNTKITIHLHITPRNWLHTNMRSQFTQSLRSVLFGVPGQSPSINQTQLLRYLYTLCCQNNIFGKNYKSKWLTGFIQIIVGKFKILVTICFQVDTTSCNLWVRFSSRELHYSD